MMSELTATATLSLPDLPDRPTYEFVSRSEIKVEVTEMAALERAFESRARAPASSIGTPASSASSCCATYEATAVTSS